MLLNGYDALMDKVINNTEKMCAANSKERLSLGYMPAQKYISFFDGRSDLNDTMKCDLARCKQYCAIIDALQ